MSIKSTILFFAILNLNFVALNAQTISGKTITTNNQPIPYATIQIGENYGVISNEEGDFSINTKGFNENELVKISCLGFETLTFNLNQLTAKDYVLNEHVAELSEVYLTTKKLSIEEILQKVKENTSKNYSQNNESEIFYRNASFDTPKKLEFEILKASELKKETIKTFNKDFEALRKQAENKTSSNYSDKLLNISKLDDSIKINVTKATKLINEDKDKSTEKISRKFIEIISKQLDSNATYKVKTSFLKVEDSLKVGDTFKQNQKDSLSKTNGLKHAINRLENKHAITEESNFSFLSNYDKNDYILEEITYFNEEPVYKISFTPKRKSEKFAGVFYVNTSDFAVVKIDYTLGENRFGERLNLKALIGIKYVENKIQGTVLYKKGGDEKYHLQYINNETQQYVYFSRPFKFIKNKAFKNDDKTVFKFNLKIETISESKRELFYINSNTTTSSSFKDFKNSENYRVEKTKSYNPEFWSEYNIIAPVEAIKSYHLAE